ncbi:MAG: hypothetical protein LBI33_10710 [Propionibacteriaceae bacterium]|jgi:ribosomal protein S1|nr:hypothetical protein [Propionibacteriaceae bacterium]
MSENLLERGDRVVVQVTAVLPFGVLVATETGVNGLVRAATASIGETITVEIAEYDGERFSAHLA